jgi:hypothetical protein
MKKRDRSESQGLDEKAAASVDALRHGKNGRELYLEWLKSDASHVEAALCISLIWDEISEFTTKQWDEIETLAARMSLPSRDLQPELADIEFMQGGLRSRSAGRHPGALDLPLEMAEVFQTFPDLEVCRGALEGEDGLAVLEVARKPSHIAAAGLTCAIDSGWEAIEKSGSNESLGALGRSSSVLPWTTLTARAETKGRSHSCELHPELLGDAVACMHGTDDLLFVLGDLFELVTSVLPLGLNFVELRNTTKVDGVEFFTIEAPARRPRAIACVARDSTRIILLHLAAVSSDDQIKYAIRSGMARLKSCAWGATRRRINGRHC